MCNGSDNAYSLVVMNVNGLYLRARGLYSGMRRILCRHFRPSPGFLAGRVTPPVPLRDNTAVTTATVPFRCRLSISYCSPDADLLVAFVWKFQGHFSPPLVREHHECVERPRHLGLRARRFVRARLKSVQKNQI